MPASEPERLRPPWVDLLERYRAAIDRPWYEIDAAAGVNPKTREQWLSGLVKNPPLVGIVRIANVLEIPPAELFAAVLGERRENDPSLLEQRVSDLEQAVVSLSRDQEVLDLRSRLEAMERQLAGESPASAAG